MYQLAVMYVIQEDRHFKPYVEYQKEGIDCNQTLLLNTCMKIIVAILLCVIQ